MATHVSANYLKLPLCPNSPNCVSSQATDEAHFVAPFKMKADLTHAWDTLKQILNAQPRMQIIGDSDYHLKAESTSLIFRFVDDLEIIADPVEGLLHIRSASRIGYGDFGVNRNRVETLRSALKQADVIE